MILHDSINLWHALMAVRSLSWDQGHCYCRSSLCQTLRCLAVYLPVIENSRNLEAPKAWFSSHLLSCSLVETICILHRCLFRSLAPSGQEFPKPSVLVRSVKMARIDFDVHANGSSDAWLLPFLLSSLRTAKALWHFSFTPALSVKNFSATSHHLGLNL